MNPRVLIMGYVWPEPKSSAAGLRDWDLVRALQSAGWEITYSSPTRENEYSEALNQAGVKTLTLPPNDPGFDRWIAESRPDYVIFDRFVTEEMFGWRVKEHSPETIRIVDTQDLHFLRRDRESEITGRKTEDTTRLRELASIYRSDGTLILSDFELALLRDQLRVPEGLLTLFPFSYPTPSAPPPLAERKNFVMIGNFRHPPNADGVLWFHREIWPLLRKELPEAEVHIYGAYPPKEMMKLDQPSTGFRVLGWAQDQYETLSRYRVNLAPLRFGAGIKGKILDGWFSGTPSVSTPTGAEGLKQNETFGGEIAEGAEDFASRAVALYQNDTMWKEALATGRAILHARFHSETNHRALLDYLTRVRAEVQEKRQSNLVGAMLWHHAHQSTKYFSRWIELKEAQERQREPDRQS